MNPDKDSFLLWMEHPTTKWVMQRLSGRSQELEQGQKDRLFHLAARPDTADGTWASLQPNAAFVQGQCDAFDFMTSLDYDAIAEVEEEPNE